MLKWPFIWLSRIGAMALAVYIVSVGWQNLGPKKPEIGVVRRELADDVISDVVEDIRVSRGSICQSALVHFSNDPSDYFTDQLRRVIEERGTLDLNDRTFAEKARNILNLRQPAYASVSDAIARGRELDAPGVLYGVIRSFESYPEGALIDVQVSLADVSTGKVTFSKQYTRQVPTTGEISMAVQDAARSFPWFKRLLYWVILVVLLPVFTIGFIRTMVRKESNKTNAFVLGIYTLVDTLLAWLLVGASLGSWWTVLLFLVAVTAALLYNVRTMTFALRLEET